MSKSVSGLEARLRKKLGDPTDFAFGKRLQRLQSKHLISRTEALIVLAKDIGGVGYLKDLAKVSPGDRQRLATVLNGPTGATSTVPMKGRQKTSRRPIIIKTSTGLTIHEPLLTQTVIRDAIATAEQAYMHMYVFENSLRNFINRVMTASHGAGWWRTEMTSKKLKEITDKVADRLKKESRLSWVGKRGSHPIYYSDFEHLITIVEAKEREFAPYFRNQRGRSKWLTQKLYEVPPSRNIIAHNNPLANRDISRVQTHLMDWIDQLDYLVQQNLL